MSSFRIIFKDLKPNIANAIKESCIRTEVRIYNIANDVQNTMTMRSMDNYSLATGSDTTQDLAKIIDRTVKDSVGVGCDLSVIVKGLMLGAFRAWPFIREDALKIIKVVIKDIVQTIFNHKGNIKEMIEGLLTAVVMIAMEFKLNVQETLTFAKGYILIAAKEVDLKYSEEITQALPNLDGL